MQVPNALHMNGGEGKYSYNRNSLYQKKVIMTTKPMLEESIAQLCKNNSSECLTMVDMGCSSGPNTLLPLWQIIETIDSINIKPPNLLYFLNDLPGNDFNTIFGTFVPDFYKKLKSEKGRKFGDCFIAAMPGNFYGRLFPANSLHFVFSSYSLHWSSQVAEGLISESGILLNKGNICLAESSSNVVHEAYEKQFEKDFTKFLRSRSEEMIIGGHMLLTFNSRNEKIPYCNLLQFLGDSLKEMVIEGKIEEPILDKFNIAVSFPRMEQVRGAIEKESSFSIKGIKEMELGWDANIEDGNNESVFDKWERGKYVASYMRAVLEPRVASHFGDAIVDDLFHRYYLKGTIEGSRLDDFTIPYYVPCLEQVRNLIKREGSFSITKIKEMEVSWDANIEDGNSKLEFNKWERGRYVGNYIRAITEPQLKAHFGDDVDIDDLFDRYSLKVVDCLEKGIGVLRYVVVSIVKL